MLSLFNVASVSSVQSIFRVRCPLKSKLNYGFILVSVVKVVSVVNIVHSSSSSSSSSSSLFFSSYKYITRFN